MDKKSLLLQKMKKPPRFKIATVIIENKHITYKLKILYINASNKQCWPGIYTYTCNIPVNIQHTKYRYVQYKYSTINDSYSGI